MNLIGSVEAFVGIAEELDKLKSVYRKSYLTDGSRNENSAEHSWHLAMAIMAVAPYLPESVDHNKAIQIALCHDICEIGAGDVCAYHETEGKFDQESAYMSTLAKQFPGFGDSAKALWLEYEQNETEEGRWVKVFDKLLPFILNIANEGRTWQEQNITQSMVLAHNRFIEDLAPDIFKWMKQEISNAVKQGWLAAE